MNGDTQLRKKLGQYFTQTLFEGKGTSDNDMITDVNNILNECGYTKSTTNSAGNKRTKKQSNRNKVSTSM